MASITAWTRLEPRARSATMQQGLQARVHDPLWLLARQWQLGEFQAHDAGSPVSARLRGEASRLSRYHAGPFTAPATGQPYDGQAPLEAVVERETVTEGKGGPASAGRAAETGLHFLRVLTVHGMDKYGGQYRSRYAVQRTEAASDADSERFLRVMAGRAVDGVRLYKDLNAALRPQTGTPALPAAPAIVVADQPAVIQAALAWLAWYDQRYSEPATAGRAWVPERMEYAFSVGARTASGETVLTAQEYYGDQLDWYDFAVQQGATLGAAADAAPVPVVRTVIPGPVAFRGMPNSRWWTFEDADADIGSVETGPEDLGRMLLVQYALTYSEDWFTMPVELKVGSLLQVKSLVVTDTFGVRTRIKPFHEVDGGAGGWRMFTQSVVGTGAGTPAGDRFFLPPVLGASLHGKPVEEVRLLRDEMANLAWAVEHKVENARGRAYDRHERFLARRPDPAAAQRSVPADADVEYQLMTAVPEHWVPLVPVLDPQTSTTRLRRGAMLGQAAGGHRPAGVLLEPARDLRLFDEEVPRAGAHVVRGFQHARWVDGSAHLWMSRRKRPGRGEGWSGLRFDVLETV